MLGLENKLVVEVVTSSSTVNQDHDLVITVVTLLFNPGRFRRHKHCDVNRYVILIRSPVDVGNIRLVLFSDQDSWLAPGDKRQKKGRRTDGSQRV